MIPRRLKMTAFGPYKETIDLDFDDLGDHRLFLITGPTGAGKSSIFEGIYFALYGQVSEPGRSARSVRSDFTEDSALETQVDYTFDVGQKTYRILRKPTQMVPFKTREGFKSQSAQVELYLGPDQAPITGLKEAQDHIDGIIGLDADQFKKIVMLPQGAFEDFLLAPTDEKRTILRHIFATEAYAQVQVLAKAQTKEIDRAYQEASRDFDFLWDQVSHHTKSEDVKTQGDRYAALHLHLGEEGKRIQKIKQAYGQAQALEAQARQDLQNLEDHNRRVEDLEKTRTQWQALQEKEEVMQALAQQRDLGLKAKALVGPEGLFRQAQDRMDRAEDALDEAQLAYRLQKRAKVLGRREVTSCRQDLAAWEDKAQSLEAKKALLAQVEAYGETKEAYAETSQALSQGEDQTRATRLALAQDQEARRSLAQSLVTYEERAQDLGRVLGQEVDARHAVDRVQDLVAKAKAYTKEEDLLEDLAQDLATAQASQNQAAIYLTHAQTLQWENQAATLAQGLEEGQACPVCGSLHHPHIQTFPADQVPDLAQAQDRVTQAQKDLLEAQAAFEGQKAKQASLAQELQSCGYTLGKGEDLLVQVEGDLQAKVQDLASLQAQVAIKQKVSAVVQALRQADRILTARQEDRQASLAPLEKVQDRLAFTLEQMADTMAGLEKDLPDPIPLASDLAADIGGLEKGLDMRRKALAEAEAKLSQEVLLYAGAKADLVNAGKHFGEEKTQTERAEKAFRHALALDFPQEEKYDLAKTYIPSLDLWEKALGDYRTDKEVLSRSLKVMEASLTTTEMQDIQLSKDVLEAAKAKSQDLQADLVSRRIVQVTNSKLHRRLMDILAQSQTLEKAYEATKHLADILNGQNDSRMDFETYVLLTYFEAVIDQANLRLSQMTYGRYSFVRKEEVGDKRRSQGLDLAMMDIYTGKGREVSTLSGGERFKAALALALGLADVVGEASGGVELSTIFIDEGFGTLDESSLDQTLESLFALQDHGRLVGIISHVAELKDRIEAQIQVATGPEGSQATFVISS